jgi:hypothetical protein
VSWADAIVCAILAWDRRHGKRHPTLQRAAPRRTCADAPRQPRRPTHLWAGCVPRGLPAATLS